MVLDHEHEYGSRWEAICSVAEKLGPKVETVRLWSAGRRLTRVAGRDRPLSSSRSWRALKSENAELRRANDIWTAAASFLGAELDRQSRK
jgi:hypothetical protein